MIDEREQFEELAAMHLENELGEEEELKLKQLLQKYPDWNKELKSLVKVHSFLGDFYLQTQKKSTRKHRFSIPIYFATTAALLLFGVWFSMGRNSISESAKISSKEEVSSDIAMEDSSEEVLQSAPFWESEETKKKSFCDLKSLGKIITANSGIQECGLLLSQTQILLEKNSSIVLHTHSGVPMLHFKKGKIWIHSTENTSLELHISNIHFPISSILGYLEEKAGSTKLYLVSGNIRIFEKSIKENQVFDFSTREIQSISQEELNSIRSNWEMFQSSVTFKPIQSYEYR
jgi:hypothetical protein